MPADKLSNWTPDPTTIGQNYFRRKNQQKSSPGGRQNHNKSQPDLIGAKIRNHRGIENRNFGGRGKEKENTGQIPTLRPEGARSRTPPKGTGYYNGGRKSANVKFKCPEKFPEPRFANRTGQEQISRPNLSIPRATQPNCTMAKTGGGQSPDQWNFAGVQGPLHASPPPLPPRNCPRHHLLTTTIGEYLQQGVLKKLSGGAEKNKAFKNRFLTPQKRTHTSHNRPPSAKEAFTISKTLQKRENSAPTLKISHLI